MACVRYGQPIKICAKLSAIMCMIKHASMCATCKLYGAKKIFGKFFVNKWYFYHQAKFVYNPVFKLVISL